jgi:hypothetical protein
VIETQEVAVGQLGEDLGHPERRSVLGEAGEVWRSPGVHERSQHGLMHGPQATLGRRDPASAASSQRIQPRGVLRLTSRR